ncbi:transcription factor bHLH47 [Senna tora]|uniref:Transcription factor bHLH47 n=1 Tax=Senna tora TaxID=362788 RepID=A0A834X4Y8_9FABA|nr:transcription factor bHLH47 [Senna tora]
MEIDNGFVDATRLGKFKEVKATAACPIDTCKRPLNQDPAAMVQEVDRLEETSKNRSCRGKKNQAKVPKRIHKAEREKMKREHLNDLFLDLANAIELNQQNNGKASILNEATRLLKDLLGQIESLKKENVSLLSESRYVSMEKNELEEENSALEVQIEKLQGEIEARVAQSKPDLNVPLPLEMEPPVQTSNFPGECVHLPTVDPTMQQGPPTVLVVPFRPHHLQPAFPTSNGAELNSKPTSVISKPHARYPTPADSWPSKLLGEQPTSG